MDGAAVLAAQKTGQNRAVIPYKFLRLPFLGLVFFGEPTPRPEMGVSPTLRHPSDRAQTNFNLQNWQPTATLGVGLDVLLSQVNSWAYHVL